ncbi:type I polyketide synthase [Paenibacillus sp. GbtcB18]|uniref:type I polyketide synthase n=1 Tax=Paenibacillus sp. GbtcB18 TaxID=2824763 RepID=UPI001C308781|nr:polyketide synthase [Paenibacillus sp. GbtcB18]
MNRKEWLHQVEGTEIAITGMAGRFPGAETIERFWENLRGGVNSIRPLSEEDFARLGVDDSLWRNPDFVKVSSFLDDYDCFDASFFGINDREAELMDPQHRIMLECCWEALENAGYIGEEFSGPIGVFAGASISTYLLYQLMKNQSVMNAFDPMQLEIGNAPDSLTSRISYKLNLKGPSQSIQSACSTSLVAVHMACQSLLAEECDMALAGGASINLQLLAGYTYTQDGILSPTGECRTFDHDAKGTVFGSGVGAVVLRRLEDAIRDGDHVYAVIRGTAVNNDGSLKVGFTAPSVEGQANVIAEAIANAGVAESSIQYIEAHGTGTALGDPIEMKALQKAFGAYGRRGGQTCAIGSVKTNIGHLAHAAGISGLIKAVLALNHKQIPPSLNYRSPNPDIDFAASPFYVNAHLQDWKVQASPRRAGVSSFGFGGTNAHAILEETPEIVEERPSRLYQLLLLSAKSLSSLEKAAYKLERYLRRNSSLNMADVSYTLKVGRKAFANRQLMIGQMDNERFHVIETLPPQQIVQGNAPGLCFLYQFTDNLLNNHVEQLYNQEAGFRSYFNQCLSNAGTSRVESLQHLLLFRNQDEDADDNCRPYKRLLAFACAYSLAKLLLSWGIKARNEAADTFGEMIADCVAGRITLQEAVSRALSIDIRRLPNEDRASRGSNECWVDTSMSALNEAVQDDSKIRYLLRLQPDTDAGLSLTKALGELWLAGTEINWRNYYLEETRRRVPLPTYAFEKRKYWVEADAAPGQQVTHSNVSAVSLSEESVMKIILAIWQKHLGSKEIGKDQHFFEAGGDSFTAVQVVKDIREALQLDLSVANLYEHLTIRALSRHICSIAAEGHKEDTAEKAEPAVGKFAKRNALLQAQRLRKEGRD